MMMNTMNQETIRNINSRLFFSACGERYQAPALKPWQYVQMEYERMGLTPPAFIPRLESLEDAEIWMCLDERVNRQMRMRETSIAV